MHAKQQYYSRYFNFFPKKWSYAQEKAGVKALPSKLKRTISLITKSYIQLGLDDPRRAMHSLKAALVITVVSFLYYDNKLYNRFKWNGIWACNDDCGCSI